MLTWGKVFKSEPSEICGRQPLKILPGQLLNTWTHIMWKTEKIN